MSAILTIDTTDQIYERLLKLATTTSGGAPADPSVLWARPPRA